MAALRKHTLAPISDAAPFLVRSERASDIVAREALLDATFGVNRQLRTCQRLRDGQAPAEGLALSALSQGLLSRIRSSHRLPQDRERTSNSIRTAEDSKCACGGCFGNSPEGTCREGVGNFRNATRLVGTVRLWHVSAGSVPALVLGPLAVDPSCRKLGIGRALVQRALAAAKARGHGAVLLLGDAPYYGRFGFSALKTGELRLPGPFEPDRLLGLELREGALDGASGMIVPTGMSAPQRKPRFAARPRKLAPRAA